MHPRMYTENEKGPASYHHHDPQCQHTDMWHLPQQWLLCWILHQSSACSSCPMRTVSNWEVLSVYHLLLYSVYPITVHIWLHKCHKGELICSMHTLADLPSKHIHIHTSHSLIRQGMQPVQDLLPRWEVPSRCHVHRPHPRRHQGVHELLLHVPHRPLPEFPVLRQHDPVQHVPTLHSGKLRQRYLQDGLQRHSRRRVRSLHPVPCWPVQQRLQQHIHGTLLTLHSMFTRTRRCSSMRGLHRHHLHERRVRRVHILCPSLLQLPCDPCDQLPCQVEGLQYSQWVIYLHTVEHFRVVPAVPTWLDGNRGLLCPLRQQVLL